MSHIPKSRAVVLAALGITSAITSHLQAASGTWSNLDGGLWNNSMPANWSDQVASGAGFTANFSTLNLTADTFVNLSQAITIGNLTFADTTASNSWILGSTNANNTLTLDNSGVAPVITVLTNLGSPRSVTIDAKLVGTNGFTKAGTTTNLGRLILAGDNSGLSGAVTLKGGITRVEHNNALGTGAVTFMSDGTASASNWQTLDIKSGVTIANTLNMPAGRASPNSGNLTMSDSTGIGTYTGTINITGTTSAGGDIAGPTGATATNYLHLNGAVVNNTGSTHLRLGNLRVTGVSGTAINWLNSGYISLGGDNGFQAATTMTLGSSAAGTLDLNGFNQTLATITKGSSSGTITNSSVTPGTLSLTGSGTYSGTVSGNVGLAFTGAAQAYSLTGASTATGANQIGNGTDGSTVTLSSTATLGNVGSTWQVNNAGVLLLARSDTGGTFTTTSTPAVTINAGGIVRSSSTYNTLVGLTLSGGALSSNGGLSATYGSFGLRGTVSVTGATASTISTSGGANNRIHIGTNIAGNATTFDVSDVTSSSATDLTVSTELANYRGTLSPFSPVQSGLTKSGAGKMLLSSVAHTYTGPTTITGGTLALGAGASISSSNLVKVGSGAIFDTGGSYTTPSVQTLGGTGTILGAVTHNSGLITGGDIGGVGGNLTFNDSLALGGGSLRFDYMPLASDITNDSVTVLANGGLSKTAVTPLNLQFAATPASVQTYRMFNYTGALAGDWSNAGFAITSNLGRATFVIDTSAAGQVNVVTTPVQPQTLVWNSASSSLWDLGTTANWDNITQPLNPDKFYNDDVARFTETGTITGITLNTSVLPSDVIVNSDTKHYTIAGTGKITGSTNLTKDGASTLTFSTNNDYTGTTVITQGTIQVGNGSNAGLLGSGAITNHGTLKINRSDGSSGTPVMMGNTISGTGAIIGASAGVITLSGPINVTGGITQAGAGTLNLTGGIAGSGGVTQDNGVLTVSGINTYNGATVINAGRFSPQSASAFGNTVGATSVGPNGQIYATTSNVNYGSEAITINGLGYLNGGALRASGNTTSTFGGTITAATAATIGV
ncbi:MAG: autotransporter-associated beta strand repeat-containing protein, partial [Burkholderiales bacterium]|nr:autotransporter-associated beta strand repeat-containing protein [Phycisphaerae bacterium]